MTARSTGHTAGRRGRCEQPGSCRPTPRGRPGPVPHVAARRVPCGRPQASAVALRPQLPGGKPLPRRRLKPTMFDDTRAVRALPPAPLPRPQPCPQPRALSAPRPRQLRALPAPPAPPTAPRAPARSPASVAGSEPGAQGRPAHGAAGLPGARGGVGGSLRQRKTENEHRLLRASLAENCIHTAKSREVHSRGGNAILRAIFIYTFQE